MSNVLVINIKKEHEFILGFLYPNYSILEEGSAYTSRFIIHKDVKSVSQRDALNVYYSDCIFISSQLFDEFWDESVIISKVTEFGRRNLRLRKTKCEPSSDSFVEDCVNFMFDTISPDEEASITELFDSFGSGSFVTKFMDLSLTIPIAKLQASLNTFVTRILSCSEASSVYYKRKAMVLAPKIKKNMVSAIDNFILREQDQYGLSLCKFYSDLFQ